MQPATEEKDGVGGVSLEGHGNERHHDEGVVGRVVLQDVTRHVRPECQVAKCGRTCGFRKKCKFLQNSRQLSRFIMLGLGRGL